jgi:hypothetical protein
MSTLGSSGSVAAFWNSLSDASEECTASIFRIEEQLEHVSKVLVYCACNLKESIWNEVTITPKGPIAILAYRLATVARLCTGKSVECVSYCLTFSTRFAVGTRELIWIMQKPTKNYMCLVSLISLWRPMHNVGGTWPLYFPGTFSVTSEHQSVTC